MSAYNIVVNDVQKHENKVVCLARIDNYPDMLNRVSIGQSITTEPIQINFDDSIGRSSWILIFYPKGQYICTKNAGVMESGRASIYLKMVYCENPDVSLAMTIQFFIKAPYCEMKDQFTSSKNATFLYRNQCKRWKGPFNLLLTEELYSNRCENFFLNDSLTIGCELNTPKSNPRTRLQTMMRSSQKSHITSTSNDYAEICDVEGRLQDTLPLKEFSSTFQNDAMEKKEEESLQEHSQTNRPNTKISKGNQTWAQKLLESSNKKIENNLRSEEPTNMVIRSSARDASKRVKETINFFEKFTISSD